jgi:hypothetical protein
MAQHTLFAYVQGTDLENVVDAIEPKLDALVAGRKWISKDVWVVNQRVPAVPGATEGTAPEWDLGLNVALAAKRTRPANWIDDAVAIATSFAAIHRETGRDFVIGIHDSKTNTTKDLFFVDGASPDLEKLRAALATGPA